MRYAKRPPEDKIVLMQNYYAGDDPHFYIYTDASAAFARNPNTPYEDPISRRLKEFIPLNEFHAGEFYKLNYSNSRGPLIKISINDDDELRYAKTAYFECLIDFNLPKESTECRMCQYIQKCNISDRREIICPVCGK